MLEHQRNAQKLLPLRIAEVPAEVEYNEVIECFAGPGGNMKIAQVLENHGRAEGIQQGMQQSESGIIRKMLARGLSVDYIADLTEFSLEKIKSLTAAEEEEVVETT